MLKVVNEIRYYRGKVKCNLMVRAHRKAIIQYLENGIVGPKWSQKEVTPKDMDIVLIRHCYRERKN